uniref:Uncharacterized protein n=1 Tax=Romanomermis culicivorax TaxID=13658 RepID=A0A915HMN6_ROMCU
MEKKKNTQKDVTLLPQCSLNADDNEDKLFNVSKRNYHDQIDPDQKSVVKILYESRIKLQAYDTQRGADVLSLTTPIALRRYRHQTLQSTPYDFLQNACKILPPKE